MGAQPGPGFLAQTFDQISKLLYQFRTILKASEPAESDNGGTMSIY